MMPVKDLTGKAFHRWAVIGRAEGKQHGQVCWLCRCECGTERVLKGQHLRDGGSKSCGCWRREVSSRQGRGKLKDLTGRRFGRLTVLGRSNEPGDGSRARYECRCDCGQLAHVAANSLTGRGTKSCGCSQHVWQKDRLGPKHPNWKGGRYKTTHGYVMVKVHGHPNANKLGYVLEHVKAVADMLGRPIRDGETVHHKNGVRDDNRQENLELWAGKHCPGQRVDDLVKFAREILAEYGTPAERAVVAVTTSTVDSVA